MRRKRRGAQDAIVSWVSQSRHCPIRLWMIIPHHVIAASALPSHVRVCHHRLCCSTTKFIFQHQRSQTVDSDYSSRNRHSLLCEHHLLGHSIVLSSTCPQWPPSSVPPLASSPPPALSSAQLPSPAPTRPLSLYQISAKPCPLLSVQRLSPKPAPSPNPAKTKNPRSRPSTSTAGRPTPPARNRRCSPTRWISTRRGRWC